METIDLAGRKGLVVGIANEHSLAWAAPHHFHRAGAEICITYLNEKAKPCRTAGPCHGGSLITTAIIVNFKNISVKENEL